MRYTPLNYDQINAVVGQIHPNSIQYYNNVSYALWERALFQRAASAIKLDVPEEWEGDVKDFLTYCLFKLGYVVVFSRDEYGTIFQPCTLSGYNLYYQPYEAVVSNPAFTNSITLKLGTDAELIKLTPDYMGIWDIIENYAAKLSNLDNALNLSLINNKFAFILGAKNKSAAQSIKKALDMINQGNPAVLLDDALLKNDPDDEKEPWQFLPMIKDMKANYITSEQLMDFQTLINSFDSEIGIPTVPYQKKERMVTDEANSKVIDSAARVTVWLESLQSSLKKVNRMFGLDIKAELRYQSEGGASNEVNIDRVD